ncbi:MAG TPA: hypothetical protein P5144_13470 [Thermoanaerobaculia bacterium]|nr:hypothetical protein [Thermoanaerobaculia bacterium]
MAESTADLQPWPRVGETWAPALPWPREECPAGFYTHGYVLPPIHVYTRIGDGWRIAASAALAPVDARVLEPGRRHRRRPLGTVVGADGGYVFIILDGGEARLRVHPGELHVVEEAACPTA